MAEHLQLYSTTGEDWKANDDVSQEKLEAKKAQSRDAAELIDQFSAREASVAEAVPASPPLATQLDSKFDEESSSPLNRKVPANVNVAAASADAPSAASSIASATGVAAATAAVKKRKQPPTAQPSRGRGRGRGGGGRGGRPRLYPTLADLSNDPGAVVGRRIARYFDDPGTPGQVNLFFGSVYDFRMPDGDGIEDMVSEGLVLWDVRYDDGDEESLDAAELVEVLKLYQKNSSKDDAAPDAAAHAAGLGADTASVDENDDDENADAADAEAAAAAPLPDAAA